MAKGKKINSNQIQKKVFINCPFDNEYLVLLRPLLFSVIYLGYEPLIASQRIDSGEIRIHKIIELIKQSDHSIHDLSRVQAKNVGEYFRLNMPFELGIDWGYKSFSNKNKQFLVLEDKAHSASRALSDFSGCDPESHENDPQKICRAVRNWIVNLDQNFNQPGASKVWDEFNYFLTNLYDIDNQSNEDIEKMPIPEFIGNIKKWINQK